MSQAVADPTTDDQPLTGLAYAIEHIDTDRDDRDCPHECHGTLSVDDDDRVLCETCRCTPSGVYLPPPEDPPETQGGLLQVTFFYPQGRHSANRSTERERYSHSDKVILPGGQEIVYDENHPAGGMDEYVWDISSL